LPTTSPPLIRKLLPKSNSFSNVVIENDEPDEFQVHRFFIFRLPTLFVRSALEHVTERLGYKIIGTESFALQEDSLRTEQKQAVAVIARQ
jgi:hypothetical protein